MELIDARGGVNGVMIIIYGHLRVISLQTAKSLVLTLLNSYRITETYTPVALIWSMMVNFSKDSCIRRPYLDIISND